MIAVGARLFYIVALWSLTIGRAGITTNYVNIALVHAVGSIEISIFTKQKDDRRNVLKKKVSANHGVVPWKSGSMLKKTHKLLSLWTTT